MAEETVNEIRPVGDVDILSAPGLATMLDDATQNNGHGDIHLVLDAVTFLDSSGVRVIVEAAKNLQESERQLIVEGASPAVRRVLELSGILGEIVVDGDLTQS